MRAKNEFKFLEEAYTQVHTEDTSIEDLVGVEVIWGIPWEEFHGVIKDIDVEKGSAWVLRDDGNEFAVDIEDFDSIGGRQFLGSTGHPDDEEDPDESALGKAFAASQTAEGPPNPGPDDLGPDRFEDAEAFDGPDTQWDNIDDPLPGSLGPKVTPTHKPGVKSYTSNDNKEVFDVLDSNGQPVYRTHSKRKAHKWFRTNYKNL